MTQWRVLCPHNHLLKTTTTTGDIRECLVHELTSPRDVQSASWQSASWRIRELCSYRRQPSDQVNRLGLWVRGYMAAIDHIHHRHLLLLLSPEADSHFTVPRRVKGWVNRSMDLWTMLISGQLLECWKLTEVNGVTDKPKRADTSATRASFCVWPMNIVHRLQEGSTTLQRTEKIV